MTEIQRDLIRRALGDWKSGKEFELPSLLGKNWPKNSGEARSLGKAFKKAVDDRRFNVRFMRKNSANLSIYEKN